MHMHGGYVTIFGSFMFGVHVLILMSKQMIGWEGNRSTYTRLTVHVCIMYTTHTVKIIRLL